MDVQRCYIRHHGKYVNVEKNIIQKNLYLNLFT